MCSFLKGLNIIVSSLITFLCLSLGKEEHMQCTDEGRRWFPPSTIQMSGMGVHPISSICQQSHTESLCLCLYLDEFPWFPLGGTHHLSLRFLINSGIEVLQSGERDMVSVFYVLTQSSLHHLSPTIKSCSSDASNHCRGSNEASATTV